MKIAFLIQEPGTGGLASMHRRLEKALEGRGHTVDNYIVGKDDVFDSVKSDEYEAVHLYFSPFLTLSFFLRLLLFNVRGNASVFVNYYNIKPENIFRRVVKRVFLPLLSDLVLLPSENMEKFYKEEIGITNTGTLRPIVPDDFFEINSTGDRLIYFGHARPDKGIDRLVSLASADDPIHCYFIQDRGSVLSKFPKIKEKVAEGSMILHDEGPKEALSSARIALFPYHNLNKTVDLPLALLESLAAGVQVLTSDIPPLNQYLPEKFLVGQWGKKNLEFDFGGSPRSVVQEMEVTEDSVVESYLDLIHDQGHP